MAFDFPSNPVNGQVYESFIYDSGTSSWTARTSTVALSARLTTLELAVPAGVIHQSTRAEAPQGYLLCQGQAISRTQYSTLFAAISTTYGTGDGSTTFNLPDLQGRVPVGKSASGTFAALNNKGGAETVTLDLTQIPSHTHTQDAHNHTQNAHNHTQDAHSHSTNTGGGYGGVTDTASGGGDGYKSHFYTPSLVINSTTATNNATTATNQATTATNQNAGGGLAHNNLQPYIVLNYIIKT